MYVNFLVSFVCQVGEREQDMNETRKFTYMKKKNELKQKNFVNANKT
jgi:hypothetical protein